MKILHTSDWHLGAYVGPQCDDPMKRMENTFKCLNVLVETARQEQPDIILVAGDIFHTAKVWAERALTEVRVAADYLNILARIAPTCVLYGTPNHDGESQYDTLIAMIEDKDYLHFFRSPEIKIIQSENFGPIQVAGLPGFDKGHFRALYHGLSAEEENVIFTQQLALVVQGLSTQVDTSIPSVLMAHHTVIGSVMDNGTHVFQANEMVLEASVLDNSNFDMVCMGHIHKAQRVDSCSKPVYYAGSVDAFTFNDEGHEKGFYLHDTEWPVNGHMLIKTPAREFLTLKWDEDEFEIYTDHELSKSVFPEIPNKVVRILYSCDSETEKALDKKKLERDLYAAGAYYVSEIRPEKIHEVVNKERLHEKLTVEDCLIRYLKEKNYSIGEILEAAYPIIEIAQANSPIGTASGLFLPLEIEVRNYRSYAEEKLSFQDIYFAMVNGRNGSGKSSLFMDALVDCLYEVPREGELTGWIRSGEKSGSISFTFQLGEGIYRVTRTRQRSGKATLALATIKNLGEGISYNKDFPLNWDDISGQKLGETQDIITQLLGMDCATFKSCVLIMQDQYGKFMEAKPEDRMSVLANLLGLGIYEDLEEETKATLTNVNRELKAAKEESAMLEQEVSMIPELNEKKKWTEEHILMTKGSLDRLKADKEIAAAKVALAESKEESIRQFSADISTRSRTKTEKQNKLSEHEINLAKTKVFLDSEAWLNQDHLDYEACKKALMELDGKANLAKDKQLQFGKVNAEISGFLTEKLKLESDIIRIQARLENYSTHESLAKKLNGVEEELLLQEQKKIKYDELTQSIIHAENKLNQNSSSLRMLESQTSILKDSNCIDIGQAQCGFLRSAKAAEGKIVELNKASSLIQNEINDFTTLRESINYFPASHEETKQDAVKYRNAKQQLAMLDGDKKLLEVNISRLHEVNERILNLNSYKSDLESELSSLQQELGQYEALCLRVKELQASEEKYKQIPAAKSYMENLLPQMEDLTKEIEQLGNEINELFGRVAVLQREVDEASSYKDSLKEYELQIKNLEGVIAQHYRYLGSINEKLTSLEEKSIIFSKVKEAILQLAERASKLQVLGAAFGQDGIPHQIMRDIVPELEASANEILSQMTGGRMRLEFRTERNLKSNKAKEVATLDIVIIDVDNGELPYLSRSGGQKVRAALAVSFALAMVKASRVGLQLGMMFVDEPPFLDADGVESYCMALETIHMQYPDMRIVAISHDENMKAHFPQQLTVVVGENGSKIMKG